jgi:thiol:disulfide interchange protein DsbC
MTKLLKTTKFLASLAGVSILALVGAQFAAAQTPSESGNLLKRKAPEDVILESLRKARPDIEYGQPRPAMIKGLYQVQVPGGPVLYVTPEGDKVIVGEMFAVEASGFARIEDPFVVAERKKVLASIDPKQSISFKPKGKPKAVVYVFTDVDCGYCRRLHSQMHTYNEGGQDKPGYNDLGIEIRYLAFPRAGIPSPSADKLISAWCAKDKQEALTKLKTDQSIASATCDNPVAMEYQMGGQVGVNGTPALFLPDGKLMPGYLPPEELAKALGI